MGRNRLSIAWAADLVTTRWRRRGQRRAASPFKSRPWVEVLEARIVLTTLPPNFVETPVVSGLISPTAMEFAPDGRLFALEQGGNVELIHSDGTTWTALHLNVDSNVERGLLGIAFDPNYNSNHFVYLYYTNPNPGAAPWATGEHNQLSRFTVDDSNPQQPVFTSEAPILDWDNLSDAMNHNGGAIHFGLDGMLYADAGDNLQTFTQGGNTYRVSQTLSNLLGKQLRIDVGAFNQGVATRDDTTVGHLIPADNPFVGTATGIDQLIYALGLRNPYTFAVQPGTGTIFINDVGESTWEEIDQSVPGANFGWSGGNTDGFGQSPPGPGVYHDPLLAYNHSGGPAGGGIAIVGGAFYDPPTPQFPASYVGKYFYADLGEGWIRVFDPANPGNISNPDTSIAFASGTPGSLVDLTVDATGNLYYLSQTGGVINKISYVPPTASSATYLATDTTTQGTWMGTYGSQGYDVIDNSSNLPSYATVTPSGQSDYIWDPSTTDPRALQTADGASRIAATWYSTSSFTVDVNLTDGLTHDLELYFVDWDSTSRSEDVTIRDAITGTVLNTEKVSSFNSGVYLDWAVSGNVLITFTTLSGNNAVLSGLFFGPPPATTSSAAFIKQDTTTQGNWIGAYGTQGYNVVANAANIPSYATVTPSGPLNYIWAASTTDPRALQTADGASRIAATWYSTTSFTVDVNLTDGLIHDLELYFVDWDSTSRSESVTIRDATTGMVLNTETVSTFNSGVYLNWAVSGNVLITFTNLSGNNAVLSGLFFDPPNRQATKSSAAFINQDTTTQGNWIGAYGTQGYNVVANAANIPSYATVTLSGQSNYVWAASTTDPRALQTADGASRIAATWYSTSSFTVDVNLTDGLTHDLELYFVDWDSSSRSESVTISDAATGTVLNTETVSSFNSGVYLDWAVSGNVLITFMTLSGDNAVVSGLFFS
jgi:glucose/arabinose dehydrogenase